jgi:uncharacterized protein with HEPN domain
MKTEVAKSLHDALQACRAIQIFTHGYSLEKYTKDLLVRSAVERQFEILGEAFSRLDALTPGCRDDYPAMGAIIGMRNRIIHGYDAVDDAIIWDAVENHVPPLIIWLQATLRDSFPTFLPPSA